MSNLDPKDPDATLDYVIDWRRWLEGDEIIASSWIVPAPIDDGVDNGIQKVGEGFTTTLDPVGPGLTVIWISGGTLQYTYNLTNRIETLAGRIQDQSIPIRMKEM